MTPIDKKQIRDRLVKLRGQVSQVDVRSASEIICQRVIKEFIHTANVKGCGKIALYASRDNEVQTRCLFDACKKLGWKVFFPRVEIHNSLCFYELQNWDDLVASTWGILEPPATSLVEEADFDLMIVPGVAFSRSCQRLGYGKGFYDRAIGKIPLVRKPTLVGLGFDFQILDSLPEDPWDIPMDFVVTPSQLIRKIG